MPHIHLQTTADLPVNADLPDLLSALVDELCGQEAVQSNTVRAHHSLISNWAIGAGAPPGFAHLTVSTFQGKPMEWHKAVSAAMMKVLREHLALSLEAGEVQVTVEIREMERESYLREEPQ